MYNYEHMAIIIKDYLQQFEGQTEKVHLTALEARKLPGMDNYAKNTSYDNVARAMDRVGEIYYRGIECSEGKRASSTFAYDYDVSTHK